MFTISPSLCLLSARLPFYKHVRRALSRHLINHWSGYTYSDYRLSESGHGREETRYYQMLSDVQPYLDPKQEWAKLNSIGRVDYLRTDRDGKTKLERRYFITSLPNNAKLLSKSIRGHWCV